MTDDSTSRDVRFALRSFRHAPLTALTIVGTVAVGLGVIAVLFTVFNSFVFRVDAVQSLADRNSRKYPARHFSERIVGEVRIEET